KPNGAPHLWQSSLFDPDLPITNLNPRRPLVPVIRPLHVFNRIKVTDDIRRPEAFAGADAFAVQLFDHADVAALMAPGFDGLRRVEGHAGEPGAGLAVDLDLVGADHPVRNFAFLALIEEAGVGGEVLGELLGGDQAVVAQVDLGEVVAAFVADVAGHV